MQCNKNWYTHTQTVKQQGHKAHRHNRIRTHTPTEKFIINSVVVALYVTRIEFQLKVFKDPAPPISFAIMQDG